MCDDEEIIGKSIILTIIDDSERVLDAIRKVKVLAINYGIRGTVQRVANTNKSKDCTYTIEIIFQAIYYEQLLMFLCGIRMIFGENGFVSMKFGERILNQNFIIMKNVKTVSFDECDKEVANHEGVTIGNIQSIVENFKRKWNVMINLSEIYNEKDRLILASLKIDSKKRICKRKSPTFSTQSIADMDGEELIQFVKVAHKHNRLKIKEETLHKFINYLKEEEFNGTSLMYIKEDEFKQVLLNDANLKLGNVLAICCFVNSLKN